MLTTRYLAILFISLILISCSFKVNIEIQQNGDSISIHVRNPLPERTLAAWADYRVYNNQDQSSRGKDNNGYADKEKAMKNIVIVPIQ